MFSSLSHTLITVKLLNTHLVLEENIAIQYIMMSFISLSSNV